MLRILAYIFAFLFSQIFSFCLVAVYHMAVKGMTAEAFFSNQSLRQQAIPLAITLLVVNLAIIAFLFVVGLVRKTCLHNTVTGRTWAFSLIGVVALGIGLGFVSEVFNFSDGGTTDMFSYMTNSPLAIVSITIVGPVFEELICREGIQRTLRERGWSMQVSIAVASSLFAVAHGNVLQGISAFAAGFYLGWLYERSGTALLPIGAHILNNSISVALLMLSSTPIEEQVPLVAQIPIGIGLLGFSVYCAKQV